jgi:hypothetical protein
VPERSGFLIPGNADERRRDYSALKLLAREFSDQTFHVVGSINQQVTGLAGDSEAANILQHANLTEQQYYETCDACRFVLPMIDPDRFPGYFEDRFTCTVLTGLGLNIPFVAHRKLFDLYPIQGFSYDSRAELSAAVAKAIAVDESAYRAMRQAQQDAATQLAARNVAVISRMIAEIRPSGYGRTAASRTSDKALPTTPAAANDSLARELVRALYRVLLLREPDQRGIDGHVRRLEAGYPVEDVVRQFVRSKEFAAKCTWFLETHVAAPPSERPPHDAAKTATAARRD